MILICRIYRTPILKNLSGAVGPSIQLWTTLQIFPKQMSLSILQGKICYARISQMQVFYGVNFYKEIASIPWTTKSVPKNSSKIMKIDIMLHIASFSHTYGSQFWMSPLQTVLPLSASFLRTNMQWHYWQSVIPRFETRLICLPIPYHPTAFYENPLSATILLLPQPPQLCKESMESSCFWNICIHLLHLCRVSPQQWPQYRKQLGRSLKNLHQGHGHRLWLSLREHHHIHHWYHQPIHKCEHQHPSQHLLSQLRHHLHHPHRYSHRGQPPHLIELGAQRLHLGGLQRQRLYPGGLQRHLEQLDPSLLMTVLLLKL